MFTRLVCVGLGALLVGCEGRGPDTRSDAGANEAGAEVTNGTNHDAGTLDAGPPDVLLLTVSAELPEGIALAWDAGALNLTSITVLRDGVVIANLPGSARAFLDVDAGAGLLSTADAGATQWLSSGIELTWGLAGLRGQTSTYELTAQTFTSNFVNASRDLPTLTGWLITRSDGGTTALGPSVRAWLDTDATTPRSGGVPGIHAWADDSTSSVMLSTDASIVSIPDEYEIEPVVADGRSRSENVIGARGGNPVLQWQRSTDDSPTTFVDLPFVHGPQWFDAEAVFDEGRYYRVVVKSGAVVTATSSPARALLWRPRLMASSSVICVLRDDDQVLCAANFFREPGFFAEGALHDVVTFVTQSDRPCGLHSDAGVTCLVDGGEQQISLPPLTQLVGGEVLCGLSASGWVCAGSNSAPISGFSTILPHNTYDSLCGPTIADGGLTCVTSSGIYGPLEFGDVELLGMGETQVCAIADGGVRCLYRNSGIYSALPEVLPLSAQPFTDLMVTGPYYGFCVRQANGYVLCTAQRGVYWATNPSVTSEPFEQYVLSSYQPMSFGCGLTPEHRLRCGGRYFRQLPPTQPVRQVEMVTSADGAYFLLESGRLAGRGEMSTAGGPGPDDRFIQVATGAGDATMCALRVDGTASCWGYNPLQAQPAPGAHYTAIAVSTQSSCGLHANGTISCWRGGWVPTGTFIGLMTLNSSVCGQRADLSLSCDFISFPEPAPGQRYAKLSANFLNACGIRVDGALECWPTPAPSSALGRRFVDVSRGHSGTCAVEDDGRPHCWGRNVTTPPWTDFVSIRLNGGGGFACGVRADRTATCWGQQYGWSFEP